MTTTVERMMQSNLVITGLTGPIVLVFSPVISNPQSYSHPNVRLQVDKTLVMYYKPTVLQTKAIPSSRVGCVWKCVVHCVLVCYLCPSPPSSLFSSSGTWDKVVYMHEVGGGKTSRRFICLRHSLLTLPSRSSSSYRIKIGI